MPPFGGNNCNQAFAITGNESLTSLWRNSGPQFSAECFNSATLEGFWAWTACISSCHSISVGFKCRLWLPLYWPFRGGLAVVLWLIVLLHNPGALVLKVTNWWPDILLRHFLLDKPLCSFWSVVAFALDAIFAQSLSYCWIMNTDLNWGKWGLQCFRGCPWWICLCAPGLILVGRPWEGSPLLCYVPCLDNLWIMALTGVHWSPKALEMVL